MIINTSQGLGMRAVGEQETTDDIHLPQLHRSTALKPPPRPTAPPPRIWLYQPRPLQAAVHTRRRWRLARAAPGDLRGDPFRAPRPVLPA